MKNKLLNLKLKSGVSLRAVVDERKQTKSTDAHQVTLIIIMFQSITNYLVNT